MILLSMSNVVRWIMLINRYFKIRKQTLNDNATADVTGFGDFRGYVNLLTDNIIFKLFIMIR